MCTFFAGVHPNVPGSFSLRNGLLVHHVILATHQPAGLRGTMSSCLVFWSDGLSSQVRVHSLYVLTPQPWFEEPYDDSPYNTLLIHRKASFVGANDTYRWSADRSIPLWTVDCGPTQSGFS